MIVSEGPTADRTLTRTCYRIVQEAVTNAIKHASGLPVDITLRGAPDTGVTIIVSNPLPDGVRGTPCALRHCRDDRARAESRRNTFRATRRWEVRRRRSTPLARVLNWAPGSL